MGIERGQATGVNSSATPRPGGAKSAAAQAAAAGGDFLAMLAALADGPAGGAAVALAAGDAALADAGSDRWAARLGDRRGGRGADGLGDEGALAATADESAGAAAMAELMAAGAAAGLGGAVAGALAGADAVAKVATAASAALAQGDAAHGRALAADGRPGRADALSAPPEPPPPGPSAEAAPAVATATATSLAGANGAAGAFVPDAGALRAAGAGPQAEPHAAYASVFEQLKSRLAAQDAAGTSPAASRAQAATLELRQSERMLGPRAPGLALSADPAGVQAGAADTLSAATGLARGARGGQQADATGRIEGGWAAPEFTPTVQYDAGLGSVQTASPTAAGDAAPLADQLRYWLSQGVTSAEWTVAGDADPVQVSLSLQGNEASIAFRSEQAGTRELLAGTVDQLRDLLQSEGLVLSGVSVGAEGSGARGQAAGGDGGSQRPGLQRRPASAPVQAVAAVAAPAHAARSAGGGVDLFV